MMVKICINQSFVSYASSAFNLFVYDFMWYENHKKLYIDGYYFETGYSCNL